VENQMKNDYMEQALREGEVLEQRLRRQVVSKSAPSPGPADDGTRSYQEGGGDAGGNAVNYRITGLWRWKNVIVPPNAYVVHTRRGVAEPLHVGLGVSFRFDPWTDAFIVVPAAMQTILINARCISRERQGVLVQGYVQWIIEDFPTAYRKLDFCDESDPMRLVTIQLREQAEAAIKDKVATMSIDEVLADKQPIIKELTARLREVMEGEKEHGDRGLGLRIVTVQIKEAIVSSPTVWEMLQRPFRSERAKEARLAELANEAVVQAKEADAEKVEAQRRIETEAEVARMQAASASVAFEREKAEVAKRARIEAEQLAAAQAHEKDKIARKGELEKLRLEQENALAEMRAASQGRLAEKEIALLAARRKVENDLSPTALQAQLIDRIPEIASKMPKANELRTVNFGGGDSVGALIGGLMELVSALKSGNAERKA
jgi:regulator of protease activity HflC (stomatin/prohibitin superfamily)